MCTFLQGVAVDCFAEFSLRISPGKNSLVQARNALRKRRMKCSRGRSGGDNGKKEQPKSTVILEEGRYELTKPLRFDNTDSHTVWKADEGTFPTL